MSPPEAPVILFDATCVLCARSVGFVAWRDGGAHRFAALRSPAGRRLLADRGPLPDSVVLLDGAGAWVRSDAALRIAGRLERPWCWLAWLGWVPRPLLDAAYRGVAAARGRAFGRRPAAECGRQPAGLAERVLEDGLEAEAGAGAGA